MKFISFRILAATTFALMALVTSAQADYKAGENAYLAKDYAKAFSEWAPLANEGDPKAKYSLGNMYAAGHGVEKNNEEALKLWYKAYRQGNSDAALRIASIAIVGKNYKLAVPFLRFAAVAGNADAQFFLGSAYLLGFGISKDTSKALLWLKLAEAGKNIDASFALGNIYRGIYDHPKDEERSCNHYVTGVSRGEVESLAVEYMKLSADCYMSGAGVDKSTSKAVKWYENAAENGSLEAQKSLGILFFTGDHVPKDISRSAKWFLKAAEQGDLISQKLIAKMYSKGDGVQKDLASAAKWFAIVADRGDIDGQVEYAMALLLGRGVEKDEAKALGLLRKTAQDGDMSAQLFYAGALLRGLGTDVDPVEGYKWLILAAKQGSRDAVGLMAVYGKKLTQSQLAIASQLASEWSENNQQSK